MGIYDREYYQGDRGGASWLGPSSSWCNTLILINVGVFLAVWVLRIDQSTLYSWFAASPKGIFEQGRIWQLLTATFLHDQSRVLHIAGNMLFLYFIGREVEGLYGGKEFLAFYLASGVFSTLCWTILAAASGPEPRYMIGASGAVLGVVTLYTLYYPRREILFMGFIPTPMWLLLTIYLIFPLLGDARSSGIAWESHVAGAAFAWAYKHFDLRWTRLVGGWSDRPRLKVVVPPRYEPARPRSSVSGRGEGGGMRTASTPQEDQLEARLDEILAKIAREGRDGLTEDERKILQEASRRARDRRAERL
jgi:membrane associated rhomboid family serine protease